MTDDRIYNGTESLNIEQDPTLAQHLTPVLKGATLEPFGPLARHVHALLSHSGTDLTPLSVLRRLFLWIYGESPAFDSIVTFNQISPSSS
jgi:hypothetical protein